MAERPGDEFYVGYVDRAPAGVASLVRGVVVLLLLAAGVLAALLVHAQRPFARSHFEFGVEREFEGVVTALPYPALWLRRPGTTNDAGHFSRYALVAFGKFGAESEVGGLDGKPVRLRGALIYRRGHTMIEVVSGSVEELSGPRAASLMAEAPPDDVDLGTHTLRGEIVDSKCFYGVMKPGNLKPHRACATRCISGGIPPVLLVRDGEEARYLLLVSGDGAAVNREVLSLVAEPVSITGKVLRRGELWILMADPSTYERLGS